MFNPNRKLNHAQKCLTAAQYKKLVKNHQTRPDASKVKVVVKFFGGGAATWLLTELDPETGNAFGLCDLGHGSPELGYVNLDEMCDVGRCERDLWFKSDRTLAEWVEYAETKSLVGV
jgi:hypothetical protein